MIKKHYVKELTLTSLLEKGAKGDAVKKVQEWLNLWRFYDPDWYHKVTVDGDFGQQTKEVVMAFQEKHKLDKDGIVGDQTFRELTKNMIKAFSYIPANGKNLRELIVKYAEQHLESNPRELFNNNTGPWVRAYMDGNEGGNWPWCAGFVQTMLDQACTSLNQVFTTIMPKTYSCDTIANHGKAIGKLITNQSLRNNPSVIAQGDLFLVVQSQGDWTHTGIVTKRDGDWIHTIEGNTNDEGSREGFEVCRRMRNFRTHNIDIFQIV